MSDELEIIRYTNSNYIGCQDSMKSTSNYIYLLARDVISWKSANQSLIVSSIMVIEFITYYVVSNHGISMQNFVTRLHVIDGIEKSLKLFCNNKSAAQNSNNIRRSTKSKYINIKFLTLKEKFRMNSCL